MYNMFDFGPGQNLLMVIVIIWSLLWKCYSVWLAAKHNHKKWFVALVVLNTLGILDIIYVFGVLKKKFPEVKSDAKKTADKIFS